MGLVTVEATGRALRAPERLSMANGAMKLFSSPAPARTDAYSAPPPNVPPSEAAALSRRVNRLAAQDLCGARSEEQARRRASWTFEERERLARHMLRSKD